MPGPVPWPGALARPSLMAMPRRSGPGTTTLPLSAHWRPLACAAQCGPSAGVGQWQWALRLLWQFGCSSVRLLRLRQGAAEPQGVLGTGVRAVCMSARLPESWAGSGLTPPTFALGLRLTPAASASGLRLTPAASASGLRLTPAASALGLGLTPAASALGLELTPAASAPGPEQTPSAGTLAVPRSADSGGRRHSLWQVRLEGVRVGSVLPLVRLAAGWAHPSKPPRNVCRHVRASSAPCAFEG